MDAEVAVYILAPGRERCKYFSVLPST